MIFHVNKIVQTIRNSSKLHKTHDSIRLFAFFSSSAEENDTNNANPIYNLLLKHQFSSPTATKVSSALSRLKDTSKCDSILTFLKEDGFSVAHLEKLIKKKPNLLASNLDRTIKRKIKILQDLGFESNDIADIFSADPGILSRSAMNRIVPSVMVLKKVFGSNHDVAEVLKVSGTFLKCDLEKTMLPNIEYLKSCGIRTEQIVKFIHSFPRFILHRPESMRKFVEKADEMGCVRNSKMFIYGVRAIASMSEESWKQKLELFRDLGFSEEQILFSFQKKPQVFAISCRKIQKAVRLVVDTGKYDISQVVRCPEMFICSVEKTLKPRLQVLNILESRNLLKKRPGFYVLHHISKQKFFNSYVLPYLDQVSEFRTLGAWRNETRKLDILGS